MTRGAQGVRTFANPDLRPSPAHRRHIMSVKVAFALTFTSFSVWTSSGSPTSSPKSSPSCPAAFRRLNGVGLHSSKVKARVVDHVNSTQDCCSLCVSPCNSWTYHPAGTHPGEDQTCSLMTLTAEDYQPHDSTGAVSGTALPSPPPGPGPGPPRPPSPPAPLPPAGKAVPPLGFQPNFVLIITDDLDVEIGGLSPMPKTRRLLADAGTTFDHFYVSLWPNATFIVSRSFPRCFLRRGGRRCGWRFRKDVAQVKFRTRRAGRRRIRKESCSAHDIFLIPPCPSSSIPR